MTTTSLPVRQRYFWFNEPHDRPLPGRPIVVDGFAGGGGASVGLSAAIGRSVDVAINHDKDAIAMHISNHPETKHYCENIWDVDPAEVCEGRDVDVAWFSPDCTHYSKARGSKPVKKNIRGLAWVVVRWAELVKPRIIFVENVEEFQTWGPVDRETEQPIKEKSGVTFKLWVWKLRELGYDVDWRVLTASDYGTPTTRKRLFIVARCDGCPVEWPAPTHGSPKQIQRELKATGHCRRKPWRTAADIVDWSLECPSIFLGPDEAKAKGCRRPLREKTLKRISEGIRRYVIDTHDPFIVQVNYGGNEFRGQSPNEPLPTVSQRHGFGVVTPYMLSLQHGGSHRSCRVPARTVTSSRKDCNLLVSPLLTSYYGPKPGDGGHRGRSIEQPLPTQPTENRFALVSAFLAKHFGGVVGIDTRSPFPTITNRPTQNQIVAATLVKNNHLAKQSFTIDEPLRTICSQGAHHAEVRAFLMRYYSQGGQWSPLRKPLPTITARDRLCLGIVLVAGEPFMIVDIGMRMLTPRELFRAQGFADDYDIETGVNGRPATKSAQVARCGNSVCPQVVEALVRANLTERQP